MAKGLLSVAAALAVALAIWFWFPRGTPSQEGAELRQALEASKAEVKGLIADQTTTRLAITTLKRSAQEAERRAQDWQVKAKVAQAQAATHKATLDRLAQERAELKKVETVAEGVAELRRLGYVR